MPECDEAGAVPSVEPLSINDAMRLIKKLEACEGVPAKLLVLRHCCEIYAASQAQRIAELEGALREALRYIPNNHPLRSVRLK